MAHTLNSQGMDTGSNYRFGDKMLAPRVARSNFDLSHLVTTTIKNAGWVFPITLWRTVPSDEFTISVRSLLRVMPQVVPLYSRQRLYIYAFYSRNGDLWENWNAFARKGLAGTTVKSIPTGSDFFSFRTADGVVHANSLADYMGIPIGIDLRNIRDRISALPFMMYIRIWRDYFFNRNFAVSIDASGSLTNTMPWLFPDNDDDFRLMDSGRVRSFENLSLRLYSLASESDYVLPYFSGAFFAIGLFPHQYPDDYFTSALPFQQRGNAPSLQADLSGISASLSAKTSNYLFNYIGGSFTHTDQRLNWEGSTVAFNFMYNNDTSADARSVVNNRFNSWFANNLNSSTVNVSGTGSLALSLNALRQLTISQLELERMARTDGSYAEFGQTFFGVTPKNAIDYKPVFIGGSVTSLSFTEVLQTSSSTDSSVLGQYAGHGIAADNDGYIGRVTCDDYGYIMILGCLMPDVYYHQGLERHWTELDQSDLLLPDRAKLGMQPILNQELYLQSYTLTDTDGNPVNEGLWAYQDAFDDYRFMNNRIHGQIADSSKLSFFPYTQARHFDSLPNWSYNFAAATDVRKDYLAAKVEDAYTCQFDINVRATRPLPYQSVPMTFGV